MVDRGSTITGSASVCSGAATPYTLNASDLGIRGVGLLRRRTWPRKRGHGTHEMLIAGCPAYQNAKNHAEIRGQMDPEIVKPCDNNELR